MKLKHLILNIVAAFSLVLIPAVTLSTASVAACGKSPAAQQVLSGVNQAGGSCGDDRVNNLFATIVNLMSLLVGMVSVIVIIYAGLKYITSAGEQGKVANAKGTLLYAIVGLAVAALAQLMIHFVLYQATQV